MHRKLLENHWMPAIVRVHPICSCLFYCLFARSAYVPFRAENVQAFHSIHNFLDVRMCFKGNLFTLGTAIRTILLVLFETDGGMRCTCKEQLWIPNGNCYWDHREHAAACKCTIFRKCFPVTAEPRGWFCRVFVISCFIRLA